MSRWLVLLVACSKSAAPHPNVLASADYVSETVGKNHSCTEIYEASEVERAERFCRLVNGPRDHCTFTRGQPCPDASHGCMYPDGSVAWIYEGEHSCMFGPTFEGEPPKHGPLAPYRCQHAELCQEQRAAIDLTQTVEAKNCKTAGGEFGAGACPTAKSIGRCATGDAYTVTYVFYEPATVEQAKPLCDGGPFVTSRP